MRSLSKKAKSFLKKIKSEKYTIDYDNFDIHAFKELLLKNPKIAKTYIEGTQDYPPFEYLHQDVFDSLYKYSPEKIAEDKIEYEHLLNSQVMDAILESQQYKDLRNMTKLDKVHSAIGTEIVGDQVKDLIEELQEQFNDALEALENAAQNAQDAESELGDEDEAGEGEEGDGKSDAKLRLEEAQEILEKAKDNLNNVVNKTEKRKINRILDKAIIETKETSKLISNWGIDQDPNYQKGGYQEKMKLLEQIKSSKKLKEIAELAGRYKNLALSTFKNKVAKGINSIYDVELGNDLGRLIPVEATKLSQPSLKTIFKKNYLEGNLLQYRYQGKEKKAKGPIVVCIDSSGSMHGAGEIWAKSVALGLLEIAKADNRSLHIIHFDSSSKERLYTNSFLKKSPYNITEVINMAEFFAGGGTLFEPPLELAKDKINEDSEFIKADIVFITDGNSVTTQEWTTDFNKWKKSRNVVVHSILIDVVYNTPEALKLFSDKVTKLQQLRGESSDKIAEVIFAAV